MNKININKTNIYNKSNKEIIQEKNLIYRDRLFYSVALYTCWKVSCLIYLSVYLSDMYIDTFLILLYDKMG